jgi:hypothetical protein
MRDVTLNEPKADSPEVIQSILLSTTEGGLDIEIAARIALGVDVGRNP